MDISITVRVLGNTKEADFYHTFPKAKEHIIPIVGLYRDYENKIEVYPYQKPNKKVVHTIKTPEVAGANLVEYMDTTPEYMQDNVIFLCPAVSDLAIAVDYAGDVRLNFTVPMVWDIKRSPNGNLLLGSEHLMRMPYFVSGIYEMSPVGKIYKEYLDIIMTKLHYLLEFLLYFTGRKLNKCNCKAYLSFFCDLFIILENS